MSPYEIFFGLSVALQSRMSVSINGSKELNMKGKICLVTGANGSLGKATAIALAQLGATVILACRDKERGDKAKADVISATKNSAVESIIVDLSIQDSIRRMATSFSEKYDRLDVLINNAAIYKSQREMTPEGLEL